jgi:hypothetical protein
MATQNVGIYALGPFDTANPTPAQQQAIADAGGLLGSAGFNTIILASMHISSEGVINYNNTTMASGGAVSSDLDPNLASVLGGMKSSGSVTNILMSFGGGGCFNGQAIGYWDFLHLKNLIAQYQDPADNPFFQNLSAILEAYPINGVDIDLEVYASAFLCQGGFSASYSEFMSTLTTLAGWMQSNKGLTTIAPYESYDFWADLLVSTYVGGTQQVAWVNLQGGPLIPADNGSFVQALQGKTIGVSDLDGFVSSGMQISSGNTADQVQSAYTPFGQANPNAGGGWLWNFSSFTPDQSSAFATAVREGLQGVNPS